MSYPNVTLHKNTAILCAALKISKKTSWWYLAILNKSYFWERDYDSNQCCLNILLFHLLSGSWIQEDQRCKLLFSQKRPVFWPKNFDCADSFQVGQTNKKRNIKYLFSQTVKLYKLSFDSCHCLEPKEIIEKG